MRAKKDILDEMTHAELIAWVRRQFFHRLPKRSEILYHRWEFQSAKLAEDYRKELDRMKDFSFAKRDELARQCNATNCTAEKLRLLEQMQPYHDTYNDHLKRYKALDRRQEKVDRLYEQIDAERSKEQMQNELSREA